MKKHLLALAILSSLAACAQAADIKVYGVLDYGFTVSKNTGKDGSSHWDTAMKSGGRNSSRFGIKGTEDLGNDYKIGFILESQFLGDTGALQTEGRLWERESSLSLSGPFGKVTVGRLGYMKGVVGSTALYNSYRVNPFGGVQDKYIGGFKPYMTGTTWSVDNSIVYATPQMAGLTGYLQYSNATNGDEGETNNAKDRYFAGALRYQNGPLFAQMLVDTTNRGNAETYSDKTHKDPFSAGMQIAYDFGFVKPFFMVEYFKESTLNNSGKLTVTKQNYDGFGTTLVLQTPVWGGQVKLGGGYMNAELSDDKNGTAKYDVTRYGVSIGYDYPMTKRTHIYTDAGFIKQTVEQLNQADETKKGYEYIIGMVHYF